MSGEKKYKLVRNEYGDVLGCNSCGSDVATSFFKASNNFDSDRRLCVYCANANHPWDGRDATKTDICRALNVLEKRILDMLAFNHTIDKESE